MRTKTTLRFYIALIAILLSFPTQSQTGPITQIQQEIATTELSKYGVDEKELVERLLVKGIDINSMTTEQLLAAQPIIEATVDEIKNEEKITETESEDSSEPLDIVSSKSEATAELEIQNFLEQKDIEVTGIYGHDIFKNKTLEVYRATEQASAPNHYVLDTGDELAVSIFGASQADLILKIGEDGFIRPSGIPRIYLKGRQLGEARKLVESRLSNYYVFTKGQFSMTLDAARTVNISILGEVELNGTFTLSALNGPLNALVAAGGPTKMGTVRQIEIIRDGKKTTVDVYDFLENPQKLTSFSMKDNDIIRVPLAKNIIALNGAVKRPMKYELLPNENFHDLVTYAGGTLPRAAMNATRIERHVGGYLKIIDINPERYTLFKLENGDIAEIPIVKEPIDDFVTITGNVLVEGRFEFNTALSLNDVLIKAQLTPGARKDVAFIERKNEDGTNKLIRIDIGENSNDLKSKLFRGDKIRILSSERFIDKSTFTIRGAVRDSSRTFPYPQDGSLSLEEAILLAGGLKTNVDTEAMIVRIPVENKEKREYLRFPIAEASTTIIKPFDEIVLYTKERFLDAPTVKIAGAVRSPGTFVYNENLTINDLIYLAAGVRFSAAYDRVEVYRLNLEGNETRTLVEKIVLNENGQIEAEFKLMPYDEIYVRSSANFEQIQMVSVQGEVKFPGEYARIPGKNRLSDFVRRAGGLSNEAFINGATLYRSISDTGYIVLNLKSAIESPSNPENILLREGDVIYIPKPKQLVTIDIRNTNAKRSLRYNSTKNGRLQVAYQGEHDIAWYVNNFAGGFTQNADKKNSILKLANGQVQETKSIFGIRNYPAVKEGSEIVIPLKPEKPKREGRVEWASVATAIASGLTFTLTTILLIDRI